MCTAANVKENLHLQKKKNVNKGVNPLSTQIIRCAHAFLRNYELLSCCSASPHTVHKQQKRSFEKIFLNQGGFLELFTNRNARDRHYQLSENSRPQHRIDEEAVNDRLGSLNAWRQIKESIYFQCWRPSLYISPCI